MPEIDTENLPDGASLKIGRSTRKNSSRDCLARLASIHHALGDRGIFAS